MYSIKGLRLVQEHTALSGIEGERLSRLVIPSKGLLKRVTSRPSSVGDTRIS